MGASPADIKVYNRHAALTMTPVISRSNAPTVNIEIARELPGERAYDWTNKCVIQVTPAELTDVLACTLGWLPHCKFTHHGTQRDKGYELQLDAPGLRIALFTRDSGRTEITASAADRFQLATALFRCLQRQHGGIAADVLHAMLASVYQG